VAVSDAELFEQIRRERRLHGTSITALAQQFGVHRRMVRQGWLVRRLRCARSRCAGRRSSNPSRTCIHHYYTTHVTAHFNVLLAILAVAYRANGQLLLRASYLMGHEVSWKHLHWPWNPAHGLRLVSGRADGGLHPFITR
jgi:hypothetical protein